MQIDTIRLTNPPKHHFFGFHDLPAWNYNGDKMLGLEVDVINRPPLPNEPAGVGYVENDKNYRRIGTTVTYNYPQGARLQWIGKTNFFIVNNIRNNEWSSDLYNAENNKKEEHFPFTCHHIHKNGQKGFTTNYARLHRLGVYGYPGIDDFSKSDPIPENDGIYVVDFKKRKKELLISIKDIANYPNKLKRESYGHHYVTHLLLNPENDRLAFLHRYPLADGGQITRLMTISIDGKNLRCLAWGFLSHFDWKDDQSLVIYGRVNKSIDLYRTNSFFSLPIVKIVAKYGKEIAKILIKKTYVDKRGFVHISDLNELRYTKIAENVITEDGHLMFCPKDRDWIINDTYPDKSGYRTLMLYHLNTNKRIDIGKYRMIFEKPDLNYAKDYFSKIDPGVMKTIGKENLAFTRSGLHCDLHPRWDMKGDKIAFDSIHEGTRQIYMIDIKKHNLLNI